jgi:hypothetical protein
MNIPRWLVFGVAALVVLFGSYRLYLGVKQATDPDDEGKQPRRGFYGMSRRTHLTIGVLYLLLGAGLVATGLGWNPFGSGASSATQEPQPGDQPGTTPIEVPAKQ